MIWILPVQNRQFESLSAILKKIKATHKRQLYMIENIDEIRSGTTVPDTHADSSTIHRKVDVLPVQNRPVRISFRHTVKK